MLLLCSGWMNTQAFEHWVKNLFVPNLPPIRPVVLLLDGHSSHIDFEIGRFCKENRVELICLPAHTSHITQPLDKGVFGPFKQEWRKQCTSFCQQHPGTSVDKFTFGRIFGNAYMKVCGKENVVKSFKSTGMWPVNVDAIDFAKMDAAKSFPVLSEIDASSISSGILPSPGIAPIPNAVPTDEVMFERSETGSISTEIECTSISTAATPTLMKHCHNVSTATNVVKVPNDTLPGCSKAVQFVTSTPIPKQCEKGSVTLEALKSLEKVVPKEHMILFRKRLEEGYDVESDVMYNTWKALKLECDREEKKRQGKITSICLATKSSASARKELLTFPTAEKRKLPAKKNALSSYHLNSDDSLEALEKKVRAKLELEEEKREKKLIREQKKA